METLNKKMEQTILFNDKENIGTEKPQTIIIGSGTKKTLSKTQQAFNRLVKKVETLRKNIQQDTSMLDENLAYYDKYIDPLEDQEVAIRKDLVKILFQFYGDKKTITESDKNCIRSIISTHIKEVFYLDKKDPDEEFKIIYKKIEGVGYDEVVQDEFDDMRDEMENMFEKAGIDVDLDGMSAKTTEEEMARKMKEIQEKLLQQQEEMNAKQSARKKTKRQLDQEAKERAIQEARNRNIGSIYKQLAKVLHPDLEQDEDKKAEKQELMKLLVGAYEKNDLHTLLQLELQWIYNEENNLETLSEEKLKIYIQVLKDQAQELEFEKSGLVHHPKYQAIQHCYNFPFSTYINLPAKKKALESLISSLQKSYGILKGVAFFTEIKKLIAAHKSQNRFDMMRF